MLSRALSHSLHKVTAWFVRGQGRTTRIWAWRGDGNFERASSPWSPGKSCFCTPTLVMSPSCFVFLFEDLDMVIMTLSNGDVQRTCPCLFIGSAGLLLERLLPVRSAHTMPRCAYTSAQPFPSLVWPGKVRLCWLSSDTRVVVERVSPVRQVPRQPPLRPVHHRTMSIQTCGRETCRWGSASALLDSQGFLSNGCAPLSTGCAPFDKYLSNGIGQVLVERAPPLRAVQERSCGHTLMVAQRARAGRPRPC